MSSHTHTENAQAHLYSFLLPDRSLMKLTVLCCSIFSTCTSSFLITNAQTPISWLHMKHTHLQMQPKVVKKLRPQSASKHSALHPTSTPSKRETPELLI